MYIDAIEKLIGEGGIYPSRSELIRVAVKDFLIRELKNAEEMAKYVDVVVEPEVDSEKYVKVPFEKTDHNGDVIREFKTYKIIKKMEYL